LIFIQPHKNKYVYKLIFTSCFRLQVLQD